MATLLLSGGFRVSDIDRMTYAECERYYRFKIEEEKEKLGALLKRIDYGIFKGMLLATRGTEEGIKEYQKDLIGSEQEQQVQEEQISSQFEEENFG